MGDFSRFSDSNPRINDRILERHKRIIDANVDAIRGKTVLDLAANNGRWSYAAVLSGASKVVSIEGRQDRVDDAVRFFSELGVTDKIEVNVGDMYDWLYENSARKVDTVLCLGVYYHVMDHYMLLRQMARLKPNTIIIDSGFVRSFRNSVHIQSEATDAHLNALAARKGQKQEVVGFVSLGLMVQMAWNLGFSCRPIVWEPKEVEKKDSVRDYLMGRRFTVRLDQMAGFTDPDWQEHWRPALSALNPRFENLLDKSRHDRAIDDRVRRPSESMSFSVFQ